MNGFMEALCTTLIVTRSFLIVHRYTKGSKRAFVQMENISKFLRACEDLGLTPADRYDAIAVRMG